MLSLFLSVVGVGAVLAGEMFFNKKRIHCEVRIDTEGHEGHLGHLFHHNGVVDGLWTYSIEDIWAGLADCYASLRANVQEKYGCEIENLAAIGISAMMHGYMAFDKNENILVPFRTWRNTNTGPAAKELSQLFNFNVPLRWSISHLYECILEGNDHVGSIDFFTTLAGYIHWQLTGRKVLGVGDASGMFPIDSATGSYNAAMVQAFDSLVAPKGYPWKILDILPESLPAGAPAGVLTAEGALKIDPSGHLQAGIPLCPPEGDAGTGMVATNAVRQRTGNVSAGTSSFSMIVLEKELSNPNEMIDMVTTPDGSPVAMVHCNNCTSDLNGWVGLFKEYEAILGMEVDSGAIFSRLFAAADKGDADCGGLISYNYVSGEPVTGFSEGRPLFVRSATDKFNLSNFMRSILYGTVCALKAGNDFLLKDEGVKVDRITGHGGLFTVKGVGQRVLAAALNSPISVMETAGEGGAWGIALLAAYEVSNSEGLSLPDYLDAKVFAGNEGESISPSAEDVAGFDRYMEGYMKGLAIERAAVENKAL